MDKLVDKFKDFFYATTDYLIILLILVVASGVVTWRLGSLFDSNNSRGESNPKEIAQTIHNL